MEYIPQPEIKAPVMPQLSKPVQQTLSFQATKVETPSKVIQPEPMVMKQKLVIEEIQESTVVTDVEANSVHEESVETIAQSVPLAQSSQ